MRRCGNWKCGRLNSGSKGNLHKGKSKKRAKKVAKGHLSFDYRSSSSSLLLTVQTFSLMHFSISLHPGKSRVSIRGLPLDWLLWQHRGHRLCRLFALSFSINTTNEKNKRLRQQTCCRLHSPVLNVKADICLQTVCQSADLQLLPPLGCSRLSFLYNFRSCYCCWQRSKK